MPGGRPSKYKIEYAEQAYNYCLLGATDDQIAEFFQTTRQSVDAWRKRHPEFLDAFTRGRADADAQMARSLWHRGRGYSHNAVKIFCQDGVVTEVPYIEHYPPDTAAASLWLRNSQPKLWRDKQEVAHTINDASTRELTDDDLDRLIAAARAGIGDREKAEDAMPEPASSVVH
jgi:hypothetical protein